MSSTFELLEGGISHFFVGSIFCMGRLKVNIRVDLRIGCTMGSPVNCTHVSYLSGFH